MCFFYIFLKDSIMKKLVSICFVLFLAACATVPPHSLNIDKIRNFKIVAVEFKGAENIASWPSEEENYRKQPNVDAQVIDRLRNGTAQKVPEIHPFFAKKLVERFEPSFQRAVAGAMNGTQPVKAIVKINTFYVPSTAARVFVNNTSVMSATIILVDVKTSAELVRYEGNSKLQRNLGGVGALLVSVTDLALSGENDLIADYFEGYKKWLVNEGN